MPRITRKGSPGKLRNKSTKGGTVNLKQLLLALIVVVGIIYVSGFLAMSHAFFPDQSSNKDQGGTHDAPNIRLGQKVVQEHNDEKPPAADVTIGFAVTVTGCGSDPITEGAAVLKHSIHLASVHGNIGGRYDYQMYAIYHPDGEDCAMPLKDLGYTLVRRETPVAVKDIEGDFLRENIEKNGCCGGMCTL